MDAKIEEIKQRLDIVEVISSYVTLQKAGQNYKMCCPFHNEKTPSLVVSPVRQIWKCFGCSEGGDIFGFVMRMEGVDFPEALRILAARAGVTLKRENVQVKNEKTRIYEICSLAAKFYKKYLDDSARGYVAKKYLSDRKFTEKTIEDFLFGYAPKSWDALKRFLLSRGYNLSEMEKSGLVINNFNKKSYDRFRDRIMFPIFNLHNDIVGFSGRVMPDDEEESAKYINTPQTIIYDKGNLLYGLSKAKAEIRKKDACILVEGNADVVACHQSSYLNTVASCGTALTKEQLRIVKRYTNNLLLAFDMDVAGVAATERSIDLAESEGINARIIKIPAGKDPADCVNENLENWQKAVSEAKESMDYYFVQAFDEYDKKTAKGKMAIVEYLLPKIKKIANGVKKAHYVQKLAGEIQIEEKVLLSEMEKAKASFIKTDNSPVLKKPQQDKINALEKRIVGFLLLYPLYFDLISKYFKDTMFFDDKLKDFFDKLKGYYILRKDKFDISKAENFTAEEKQKLNMLALEVEDLFTEDSNIKAEIVLCLNQLRRNYRRIKIKELGSDVKAVKKVIEDTQEIAE